MTEEFPIEPARPERGAEETPRPEDEANEPESEPLEQPIPAQAATHRSWSATVWAVVAGVVIVGGMTALIGGSFWYAQNYRQQLQAGGDRAEQDPEAGGPVPANSLDDDVLPLPGTPGDGDLASRTAAANEDRRREQEARRREDEARRREQVIAFNSLAEKTQGELDELLAAAGDWRTQVETLLEAPPGRRIAGSEIHVERFISVYENDRLTEDEVTALQSRFDTLRQPLRSTGNESASQYAPSAQLAAKMQELGGEIRTALRRYRQDRLAVESLVDSAAELEPAEKTLREAISAFHRAEENRRAERVAEARRKAREEIDRQLAEAEAAKVEAEGKIKLLEVQVQQQQAEDTLEALAALAADQAKAREEARKKAELERRFVREWPKMRAYLVPFTSDGLTQPGGYGFQVTGTKGPVSLGKLQGMGMLNPDLAGLKKLYSATTINRMNDRDRGGFPPYVGGDQDWTQKHDTIKMIQDFLNDFGPLMVEKELLAP